MGRGASSPSSNELLYGEHVVKRDKSTLQPIPMGPAPIVKHYRYGGRKGTEEITDFEDFALFHIQDEAIALTIAERLLRDGESINDSPADQTYERYEVRDRDELIRQLVAAREAAPEHFSAHFLDLDLLRQ